MMEVAGAVGEQRGHAVDVAADQVAHGDGEPRRGGVAERQAGDGADVIFELAGHGALDRPVAAVVDARRHFVEYRSEEHTSELQSLMRISYAVYCLKHKKQNTP